MLHAIHRASTPGSRKILRSVAVRSCQTLWRLPLTHGPKYFRRCAKFFVGSLSWLCRLRCASRISGQYRSVDTTALSFLTFPNRVSWSTDNLLAKKSSSA